MMLTAWVVRGYGELLADNRTTLSRLLVLRNALLVAIVVLGFVRLVAPLRVGTQPAERAPSVPGTRAGR